MVETVDECMARIKRARGIQCPCCDETYIDEDGICVTHWGEDGPAIVGCLHCECEFVVHETVHRTYESVRMMDE